MRKEASDPILNHIKEQITDMLGYEPNNNDLDGVLSNILEDIQTRTVEYTGFITGGVNNEQQK